MKEINLSKNILELRKKKGITQEELASSLNISSQAVSKWENNVCLPDSTMLVDIADFFDVSIDYLFYGDDLSYSDIYEKIYKRIIIYPQKSIESFDEGQKMFEIINEAISHWKMKGEFNGPLHNANENGISISYNHKLGIIASKSIFEEIDLKTIEYACDVFKMLSKRSNALVLLAIISMDDIFFNELKETIDLDEEEINDALNELKENKIIVEKVSKHKVLGSTYRIEDVNFYNSICLLFAIMQLKKVGEEGISCNSGVGDFKINFK